MQHWEQDGDNDCTSPESPKQLHADFAKALTDGGYVALELYTRADLDCAIVGHDDGKSGFVVVPIE